MSQEPAREDITSIDPASLAPVFKEIVATSKGFLENPEGPAHRGLPVFFKNGIEYIRVEITLGPKGSPVASAVVEIAGPDVKVPPLELAPEPTE